MKADIAICLRYLLMLLFFLVCKFSCFFNTERMTAPSFSISMGFAMCPFIPASNAVPDIILKCIRCHRNDWYLFCILRFNVLICLAASNPSITGIIISISIASNVPTGLLLNNSTACCPSLTIVIIAPSSSKSISATSAFNYKSGSLSHFAGNRNRASHFINHFFTIAMPSPVP